MFKLKPGVVSVSFRKHTPERIIDAAKEAGLDVIEWGGDVHSPAGDVEVADEIATLSAENDIELVTYGSYYRLGKNTVEEFRDVIASALTLGVKIIRVWGAGYIPECSGEKWDYSVACAKEMCDMAKESGLTVCLECHNDSITEEYHSALKFLADVDRPNMRLYWQINEMKDKDYNLAAAEALAPYVECIHTFYFKPGRVKVPLAEGLDDWRDYLAVFRDRAGDRSIPMLLEFMPDDRIESLEREGETLIELIASLGMLDK